MARASYNMTVGFYHGPGSATPGVLRFAASARFVAARNLVSSSPIAFRHIGYVNWNGPAVPAGGTVIGAGFIAWSFDTADRVEIPLGSGNFRQILRVERIRPRIPGTETYFRAYVQ